MAKQNIVVVGGGYAGAPIARQLALKVDTNKYNVILVSNSDVFVHLPALLRMVVSDMDDLVNQALVSYDKLFTGTRGTVKVATVTAVEDDGSGKGGAVVLHDGERLSYRYLVLATGSVWEGPVAFPRTKREMITYAEDWRRRIQSAQSIAIIGAGAVGLELAGEIRDVYPNKKITVVHAEKQPLNATYPARFRSAIEKRWRKRNIDLVLGDRINEIPEGYQSHGGVKTQSGRTLDADLVIPARGGRPNTAFLSSLAKADGNPVLDSQGRVETLQTFQAAGHPNIFVAGDITSFNEVKQAAKIAAHTSGVVANVVATINGQALKPYKGSPEGIFVTNGKGGGQSWIGILCGVYLGDFMTATIKAKGLFIGMARKAIGY